MAVDFRVVWTLAQRTFRAAAESPIAYVVAIFFYGFVGALFGLEYFVQQHASITGVGQIAPWVLWFVVPALTMGLFAEEFRLGTFEQIATLPLRDVEIVLGKFLGFAMLAFLLTAGLFFYAIMVALTAQAMPGIDWGAAFGVLSGLFLLCLSYGAMGLFASSLSRNQVVALIIGMIFCTFFFFTSQFSGSLPGPLAGIADAFGVISHLETLARGVWDIRDLLYFVSLVFVFLYLTVQRLSTRRF